MRARLTFNCTPKINDYPNIHERRLSSISLSLCQNLDNSVDIGPTLKDINDILTTGFHLCVKIFMTSLSTLSSQMT